MCQNNPEWPFLTVEIELFEPIVQCNITSSLFQPLQIIRRGVGMSQEQV